MPLPAEWGQEEPEEPVNPYYPNEGVFLNEWLLVTMRREWSPRTHWCLQWVEHPEARVDIKALWQGWEAARLKPETMGGWLVNVCYPLFDRLTSQEGPFLGCTYYSVGGTPPHHDDQKQPLVRELPRDPLPDGYFTDVECEWEPERSDGSPQ